MKTKLHPCAFGFVFALGLQGCATSSIPSIRHYKGIVVDAITKTPVANAHLMAFHDAQDFARVGDGTQIGNTISDQHGYFDFSISSQLGKVNRIEATVDTPRENYQHPKPGNLGFYGGELDAVSENKSNTVSMRKSYMN